MYFIPIQKERMKKIKEKEKEFIELFRPEIIQFLNIGYCISNKPCSNKDIHSFHLNTTEYLNKKI